jgi:hypothetical protein
MPGNGHLIRSIRAGGGPGLAAAQELLRRAQAGTVTGAELREVQKLVKRPELQDAFKDVAQHVTALLAGEHQPVADAKALAPDTSKLTDALSLPARFLSDLKLVEPQLLQHPGLTSEGKAERAFEFFEPYAQRFTELAPALSPSEVQTTLARFEKALARADFGAVRTDDGRSGLEAARELLEAKTPEAFAQARPQKLDAPKWKEQEQTLRAQVETERRMVQLTVQPQLRAVAPKPEEVVEGRRQKSGTDKVLGSNMLWNVMHLMRGEELDDVARKDALNRLVVSAALLLVFGSIVVGILVLM